MEGVGVERVDRNKIVMASVYDLTRKWSVWCDLVFWVSHPWDEVVLFSRDGGRGLFRAPPHPDYSAGVPFHMSNGQQ